MSRAKKKISVITVCRNEKGRIRSTMNSVLDQDYDGLEYIVIDGNSNDGTQEVIEEYQHRIAHYVSEPDAGIFPAMNKGAELSCGEYLYFINAGDRIYGNNLFTEIFRHDADADLIYGDVIFDHASRGQEIRRQPSRIDIGYLLTRTVYHPAVLIRRPLFMKLGGYDEAYRISGDYDFMVRAVLRHHATTRYAPITYAVFDTGGVSANLVDSKEHVEERLRIQKQNFPVSYYWLSLLRMWLMRNRNMPIVNFLLKHGHSVYRLFKPV